MQVKISREARHDVIEIATFIAKDNPDAAYRFVIRFEETIDSLSKNPLIGSSREFEASDLENTRFWPIKEFRNYLLFYRVRRRELDVLRVVNARRDFSLLFESE